MERLSNSNRKALVTLICWCGSASPPPPRRRRVWWCVRRTSFRTWPLTRPATSSSPRGTGLSCLRVLALARRARRCARSWFGVFVSPSHGLFRFSSPLHWLPASYSMSLSSSLSPVLFLCLFLPLNEGLGLLNPLQLSLKPSLVGAHSTSLSCRECRDHVCAFFTVNTAVRTMLCPFPNPLLARRMVSHIVLDQG